MGEAFTGDLTAVVEMILRRRSGHLGSSTSVLGVLRALLLRCPSVWHGSELMVDLVLSKGHAAPALYAVLASSGLLCGHSLDGFRRLGSGLEGHPRRGTVPSVITTTGSLGVGVAFAVGRALQAGQGSSRRPVVCVMSDGEMQCGVVVEALQVAARYQARALLAVVDNNGWQTDGPTTRVSGADVTARLDAIGIRWREVDGHDEAAVAAAVEECLNRGPMAIVARTQRFHGLPLPEGPELYGENVSEALAVQLMKWCEADRG